LGVLIIALEESDFVSQEVPLVGVAKGNCTSSVSIGAGPSGDMVVAYTGLRRDDKMMTMWF